MIRYHPGLMQLLIQVQRKVCLEPAFYWEVDSNVDDDHWLVFSVVLWLNVDQLLLWLLGNAIVDAWSTRIHESWMMDDGPSKNK